MVFVTKDITELKQAEERLHHLANHDSLTDLPNRALLMDRLEQILARVSWHDRMVAIMFLDLDRFKVNDTLGHEAGDYLLKKVAKRLSRSVRKGDTVARLGGDEFIVVLNDIAKISDLAPVAEKIIAALRQPIELGGQVYTPTTSIGIALAPRDGGDPVTLTKRADTAMYEAKRQGRNAYCIYSPAMQEENDSVFRLEAGLRRALEQSEFRVYYQPLVIAGSRKVIGGEALLRWQSPDNGLLTPAKFLPLAEETGLIVPIGLWVLEMACRQIKTWQSMGSPGLMVSVNLADRQFRDPGIVDVVHDVLTRTGLEPQALNLELTEGILMHDISHAVKTVNALRALGVRLSVDDFGTGYSSLAHLKRFALNSVKIDRSFVQGLPQDEQDKAVTQAIIGLAKSLKLEVIPEGVETEEQAAFLEQAGSDVLQGYLFSRPLPADEFQKLLDQQKIVVSLVRS